MHDVEAYARTADEPAVVALLSTVLGPLAEDDSLPGGGPRIFDAQGNITVVLQPSDGGYLSVWIRHSDHWPSSPALGRFLARHLRCVVRCDPEREFPEVSPYSDLFLQIDGDVESLVVWG